VSSKTAEFLFTDADTVATITQHVFDNWPSGKCHFANDGYLMLMRNIIWYIMLVDVLLYRIHRRHQC